MSATLTFGKPIIFIRGHQKPTTSYSPKSPLAMIHITMCYCMNATVWISYPFCETLRVYIPWHSCTGHWDLSSGENDMMIGKGHSNQVMDMALCEDTLVTASMDDSLIFSSVSSKQYGYLLLFFILTLQLWRNLWELLFFWDRDCSTGNVMDSLFARRW